jgi:hypothetical protein
MYGRGIGRRDDREMSQVGVRIFTKMLSNVEVTEVRKVSLCPAGGGEDVSEDQETERPKPAEDIMRRVAYEFIQIDDMMGVWEGWLEGCYLCQGGDYIDCNICVLGF